MPSQVNITVNWDGTNFRDKNGNIISVGANGPKGGFRVNAESSTIMAAPAAGGFRINASNTAIAISTTGAVGSLNIDPILSSYQVGGTIRIESNDAADTSFIQATINSITDNTTWFQFGVTTISSAAFTAGEACVLNYVDSAETPTYTSLDDASLPAAAANPNLIVSLAKIKANLPTAKRCLAISDGSVYRGIGEIVLVDNPTTICTVAPNTGLTWSVTNSGGFVLATSSAPHGLTGGVCNKEAITNLTVANLHVDTTSAEWPADTLLPIDTVNSTTEILTKVPWEARFAGTAPVISTLGSGKCKLTSFILPPPLLTSRFIIHAPVKVTNSANTKGFSIELGATELFSPSTLVGNAGQFAEYVFYNKNSTAVQETRGAPAAVTQVGQQANIATAAVETSGGAAVVTLYSTHPAAGSPGGAVNELIGIRSLWASMWY